MTYEDFIRAKQVAAPDRGAQIEVGELKHPFFHVRAISEWAIRGGRRAVFSAFGTQKTAIQLTIADWIVRHEKAPFLICAPLGVRQEFRRDADRMGVDWKFIQKTEQMQGDGLYLTNYESIRENKIDVNRFIGASLDEASILRGFGGTKTFRQFMQLFEFNQRLKYRFVATATPSPNEYIELLAYAGFLEVMDIGQAKTRFFKRDSTKADKLTLHPHKAKEFWEWVSKWAIFLQHPKDICPCSCHQVTSGPRLHGCTDCICARYTMPEVDIRWHEVSTGHADAGHEPGGQGRLLRNAALGLSAAAKEKRDSRPARIAKLLELREENPEAHRVIWHDLESERAAIEKAMPTCVTVYGNQKLEDREEKIIDFSEGRTRELAGKPSMLGSGCNFQYHCAWAIYLGIGFKFNDFIQAWHRLVRFGQEKTVRVDLIYTESEREIRQVLLEKWERHKVLVAEMTAIIRKYGLAASAAHSQLARATDVERIEVSGENWTLVQNDSVDECKRQPENSVGLILTSIPFSTQYEYSPNYRDFGHSDSNDHFFEQMDFLTPELYRMLKPGRCCAIHVKDRIVPGGLTGLGFQTVYPFHCQAIAHYQKHGFAYLGMKTIVTDVVRENNQTYRLGWSEQCKDGSRMGVGMPEYLLLFRKPPTDRSKGYADEPVVKSKADYSRSRWQVDAHGFARSSGNRLLTVEDLHEVPHQRIFRLFRQFSREHVYDFEHHVKLSESLETCQECKHIHIKSTICAHEFRDGDILQGYCQCTGAGRLPVTFMLLQPQSWSPEVWTDITRMLSLNSAQSAAGREMHLCLAKGSLVLTRKGYRPIETVVAGDQVLTHRGRWRAVTVSRSTGIQKVVKLVGHGIPALTLTPGHKLWMRNVGTYKQERRRANAVEPEWMRADEAARNYANLKLPPIKQPTITDPLLWWVVGRWLADGHWSSRDSAVISCGYHEIEDLTRRLGRFGGNKWSDVGTGAQITLKDKSHTLRDYLEQCGHGASGKRLPPEAYSLPEEFAAVLLHGYFSGDGNYIEQRYRWQATSISRGLLLGMALLAQRAYRQIATIAPGRPPRMAIIQGRTVSCQQEWSFSCDAPLAARRKRAFILDDGAWKKIRTVEDAGEVETWNLRVDEDESYTAEGCIVKNCPMQFDIADRVINQFSQPGEVVFDPFVGIGTVVQRALKLKRRGLGMELSASYFRDAVFYCEAAEKEAEVPSLFDLTEPMEEESEEKPLIAGLEIA